MKIQRIDHVGVIVNDLSATKEFFLDFGLEVKGEWEMEGELMGYAAGLNDVKVACVGLGTPDGQTWIELIKFYSPSDEKVFSNPLQIHWVSDILHLLLKILKLLLRN